ncbi:hypothetical protein M427DRAFT_39932 [Gonapodya prolifera JEL478]|uniref:Uncharacterized protein n=1 Tax=Gonapodya prolifera (strain JEL478) TaxID=1344416 RepID=A0A138ZWC0_GONPJ|nr:hypothetical protein M427DRAFT_39932 [Gonapodya prolifera JEL478]|eukprot:KXS08810.1 hypothetical protein M427DRAFT_39932 [Gonapodya prolifera JEL478]
MSFQYTTSSINFFRSDFLLYTMWIFFIILAAIGMGVRFIIEEQERHQVQRSLQEKRRTTIKRAMSKREGRSGADTGSDMKSLPSIRDDDRSRNLSRQPSTGRREIPPAADSYGESRRFSPRDNNRSPPSGGLARKPSQREGGGGYQRSPDRDPFADPPQLRRADSASRSRKPTPYRLAEPDYGDAPRRVPNQRRPMDDRDDSRQFSAKPSQVFTVELPASFATDVTGDGRGAPRSRSVPRGEGLQRSGSGSNGGTRSRSMARPASGVERSTSRRYYD